MNTADLRFAHVLSFCIEHPWAITRPWLHTIVGIVSRRAAGGSADPHEIEAALANRKELPQPKRGSVAVIPIYGVIMPRANLMSQMSGGTTYDVLTSQLREAIAAPGISTIVLDIDSPGGSVAGATEFAREVMKARTTKPIVAVANFTMASAAYWAAAGATEIVASPSASVGSIGVLSMHEDLSQALEREGIKQTFITSSKYKAEANPAQPLSDDARAHLQARVDEADGLFVADIAAGRGIKVAQVRKDFGQGRMFSAQEAVDAGMVDKIATLDDTLARLASTPRARAVADAALASADVTAQPIAASDTDIAFANEIESALLGLGAA